jgi:hypothetical protein
LIWANFVSKGKGHFELHCLDNQLPSTFMLSPKFGVTKAWYDQFSHRLLYQYTSFWGEAKTHLSTRNAPSLSESRLKNYLCKAWVVMRWLERAWERGQKCITLRLDLKVEEILAEGFSYYYMAMRRRRAQLAKDLNLDVSVMVVDGHQKLTRRVCMASRVCTLPHAALGQITMVGCPATPAPGHGLCKEHLAIAQKPLCILGHNRGWHIDKLVWKASVAPRLSDMLTVYTSCGDGKLYRADQEDLPPNAVLHHLCQQGLAHHAKTKNDASARCAGEVLDEATKAELSEIQCTTHKMGSQKSQSSKGQVAPNTAQSIRVHQAVVGAFSFLRRIRGKRRNVGQPCGSS